MTRTATTRSFNYTGRHRIEEDHLVAQLSKDDESIILSLRTNFDRPPGGSETPLEDLLEDAEMTCVEVYLRGNSERFDINGLPTAGKAETYDLTRFRDPLGLKLRLTVLDREHKVLASIESYPLNTPSDDADSNRLPLLPFKEDPDLGPIPCKLDIGDDGPWVLVGPSFPNWRADAASDDFVLLVYPAVVRQIFHWLVDELADSTDDNPKSPLNLWTRFFDLLCPGAALSLADGTNEDSELENRIVTSFCERINARALTAAVFDVEEDQ